jgi:hypothetical protein
VGGHGGEGEGGGHFFIWFGCWVHLRI